MVRYVGIPEDEARARLSTIGTQLLTDPDQQSIDAVEATLPPEIRDVRAAVVIPPPPAGDEHSGMGAWHVNAETEAHLVVSGEGLVEFMTPDGPVARSDHRRRRDGRARRRAPLSPAHRAGVGHPAQRRTRRGPRHARDGPRGGAVADALTQPASSSTALAPLRAGAAGSSSQMPSGAR